MSVQDLSQQDPGLAPNPAGIEPPQGRAQVRHTPEPPVWTRVGLAMLLAGGLAAGGLAGGTLALMSSPQGAEIDQVAAADIDDAASSFPRAEIGTHVEDAKACRVPLAVVTLVPRDGSTGHVRIRSGDYWTPVIHLGSTPIRVALPFPAPYPSGIGAFQVEGDNAAFNMYLRPGWIGGTVQGTATVRVWWRVKTPC